MDNTVTVVGNVTRDPDLRFLSSGVAKVTVGLAVNRRWRNQQGEFEEQTSFFDVVCWRDLANNVAESIEKGDRIIVNGRLEQRSWDTPEGEKRYKIEIVADEIGPSLRWATAKTERIRRDGPAGGGYSGGQGGGGYSGGNQGGGSRGGTPDYDHGEEPF